MSGCQCPDACGRDHQPDDGCGPRRQFVRLGLDGRIYHVCHDCAEEIVARRRGCLTRPGADEWPPKAARGGSLLAVLAGLSLALAVTYCCAWLGGHTGAWAHGMRALAEATARVVEGG